MEPIKVRPYKNDPRSFFTYLGAARVKEVAFQHTESPELKLLDIIFEIPLDDHNASEFLVRLETPMPEVQALLNKLVQAVEHPMPHPWDEDKFYKAVTGETVREQNEVLLKKFTS